MTSPNGEKVMEENNVGNLDWIKSKESGTYQFTNK